MTGVWMFRLGYTAFILASLAYTFYELRRQRIAELKRIAKAARPAYLKPDRPLCFRGMRLFVEEDGTLLAYAETASTNPDEILRHLQKATWL